MIISSIAQQKLMSLEKPNEALPPRMSFTVEEARALIAELWVDMAADNTPAISNPFNPAGR